MVFPSQKVQELRSRGKEFGHYLLESWGGMTRFTFKKDPFFARWKVDDSGPRRDWGRPYKCISTFVVIKVSSHGGLNSNICEGKGARQIREIFK